MEKIKYVNEMIESDIPYFICPNELFDKKIIITDSQTHKQRSIDCQETLIFIFLLRCCNGGKKAFPSYNYIADKCKCSKRKAMYAITNLFDNDFIVKKNRGYIPGNENQIVKNYSNIYEINHKKLKNIV